MRLIERSCYLPGWCLQPRTLDHLRFTLPIYIYTFTRLHTPHTDSYARWLFTYDVAPRLARTRLTDPVGYCWMQLFVGYPRTPVTLQPDVGLRLPGWTLVYTLIGCPLPLFVTGPRLFARTVWLRTLRLQLDTVVVVAVVRLDSCYGYGYGPLPDGWLVGCYPVVAGYGCYGSRYFTDILRTTVYVYTRLRDILDPHTRYTHAGRLHTFTDDFGWRSRTHHTCPDTLRLRLVGWLLRLFTADVTVTDLPRLRWLPVGWLVTVDGWLFTLHIAVWWTGWFTPHLPGLHGRPRTVGTVGSYDLVVIYRTLQPFELWAVVRYDGQLHTDLLDGSSCSYVVGGVYTLLPVTVMQPGWLRLDAGRGSRYYVTQDCHTYTPYGYTYTFTRLTVHAVYTATGYTHTHLVGYTHARYLYIWFPRAHTHTRDCVPVGCWLVGYLPVGSPRLLRLFVTVTLIAVTIWLIYATIHVGYGWLR